MYKSTLDVVFILYIGSSDNKRNFLFAYFFLKANEKLSICIFLSYKLNLLLFLEIL